MTRTLGFTGDVMLGRKVDERQRRRDATRVWGDCLDRLRSLDGLFVNLECCLSTRGEPYTDTYHPFHFRADPGWAVPALEVAGVDWTSLANNHVLDYGEDAMVDTLQALDSAGIVHSGAGRDAAAAFEPAAVPVAGDDPGDSGAAASLGVAVVSLTDNVAEWAAGPESPGVAHVRIDREDPDVRERVRGALADARALDPDLIVASVHWGPNMTEGPDEARRAFGRWLVSEGVDLVHGHSAHVFHGVEVVEGGGDDSRRAEDDANAGLILYDTGDFVDDYAVDADLRNDRGFLFVLEVSADGAIDRLRLEPTVINECAVDRVAESDVGWWHETMRERTERFDLGTAYDADGAALVVEVA